MFDDVQAMTAFYATSRGQHVTRLLRRHLQEVWPDLSRQTVLGLGHTAPFLPVWQHQAHQCIDAVATSRATGPLLGGSASRQTCLVQDDALPFPDQAIDRVLMVHAIETAAQVTRTLRAVWRVMRDDGRLLIVVANRTGLWAHNESTPFADGAPCSAGVLVVEAVKDLYAAIPVQAAPSIVPRRRILARLTAPAAARSPAPAAVPGTDAPGAPAGVLTLAVASSLPGVRGSARTATAPAFRPLRAQLDRIR
jgi:SAM-dependent methyltransferase